MITRIWHGWTSLQNAAAYEALLIQEIFPTIQARKLEGYRGISLLKREVGAEMEFTTTMWFDSIEAVQLFAGPNYQVAVVPPKARALLSRFDQASVHCETVVAPPLR